MEGRRESRISAEESGLERIEAKHIRLDEIEAELKEK